MHADDVFLADTTRENLEDLTNHWKICLDNNGMWLNNKKTEYLEDGQQTDSTISIGGEDLKKVTTIKYLGSTLSSEGDILPDVHARINAEWAKWRLVTGVLCDH